MLRGGLLVFHLFSFFNFCIILLTMKYLHVGYNCAYASPGLEICVFKCGRLISRITKSLCLEQKYVQLQGLMLGRNSCYLLPSTNSLAVTS